MVACVQNTAFSSNEAPLRWPAVGEVRNLSCVSSGEEPVLHGDKAGENEAHHL